MRTRCPSWTEMWSWTCSRSTRAGCTAAWSAPASRACCLPTMWRPSEWEGEKKEGEKKGGGEGREREERKSPVPSHLNAAFSWFYSCSLTCPVTPPPFCIPSLLSLFSSTTDTLCLSVCLSFSVCLPACLCVCTVCLSLFGCSSSSLLFPSPGSTLVLSQVEIKSRKR